MISRNVKIDEKLMFDDKFFENIDGSLVEEENGGEFDDLEDFGLIPGDPFVELPHVADIEKTFPLPPFREISTSQSPTPNFVLQTLNSVLQFELPKINEKGKRTKRSHRRSTWPGIPQFVGSSSKKSKQIKEKKLRKFLKNKEMIMTSAIQPEKKCMHCEITETPQWRAGPMGPKTLCNACGVRYRSGRLFPEYRPVASPTFVPYLHSNSHKKVLEMRNKNKCHVSATEFVPMSSNLLYDI